MTVDERLAIIDALRARGARHVEVEGVVVDFPPPPPEMPAYATIAPREPGRKPAGDGDAAPDLDPDAPDRVDMWSAD